MELKLANGRKINLNDLDNLENQSSNNKFLKFFDKLGFGGDGNNIFDKKEIEKIKAFLIEMSQGDGVIDQNDVNKALSKYSSIFENYNSSTMADDISMLTLSSSETRDVSDKKPLRTVNSGDTIDKIIKSLGYEGADAKKYREALVKQLEENNSFMNDRQWLLAGSKIELLSDKQIQQLGIKKTVVKKQTPPASQKKKTSAGPSYTVNSGDTVDKIIKSLGYEGADAKKYRDAFVKQLEENNSFMNDRQWLLAGSKIELLSDETLKELGIAPAAPVQEPPEPEAGNLSNNQQNTDGQLLTDQSEPINTDDSPKVVKNSANRIKDIITQSGHKVVMINENELDAHQKYLLKSYKGLYKVEPQLIKDATTGDIHMFFDTENSGQGKALGMQSMDIIFGTNGFDRINRFYTNGKIVQDVEFHSGKGNYSTLIQGPLDKKAETRKVIDKAIPISISVDPSVLADASESEREEIMSFVHTLEKEKPRLMKDLGMDNDTYNKFAKMSLAIAMQETNFGKCKSYAVDTGMGGAFGMLKDSLAVVNIGLKEIGIDNPINDSTATSKGLTQVKVGDWDDDPRINKLFEKYGIKRGYYTTLDGKQSAVATMIVLNELRKKVKGEAFQNGIEAAGDRYYISAARLVNGEKETRTGGYLIKNNITEDDAILYLYNGAPGAVKKGTATPDIRVYTHNAERYKKLFTIKENSSERAAALKNARTVTENAPEKRKSMQSDLGWGIGHVTFMPRLYNGGTTRNTEKEIDNLQQTLLLKGYDARKVNNLISQIRRGEISFGNGLTTKECSSLTEQDLELILVHSAKLKQQLKGVQNEKKQRQISMNAELGFKQAYQTSHARQISLQGVESSSVILNDSTGANVSEYPDRGYRTGAQKRCNRYLNQLRNGRNPDSGLYAYQNRVNKGLYTGFNVERDKGINTNNTSDINLLLAQNGADAANTLRTSGGCLTGAKQALIGSGAVQAEEMSNFSNAFQLANFLSKHPERFEEVKYVQLSGDVARELTAADIKNLPAGYIVVYGNKSRIDVPGHAAITSGNGQLYADETDNSNWDNFASKVQSHNGKGEHGYVRVFRLKPEYFTVDKQKNVLVKS